jgi:glycosyltransferase involved in cell wall biosynthesis
MNILFLTIIKINDIKDRGIYHDLMRKFVNEGHKVYILTPLERRHRKKTTFEVSENAYLLKISTLNIQKTNVLEKWFATYLLNHQFLRGIKKYFSEVKFNLVIYSTPPITFASTIKYIRKKDSAISYLLLKDIFPQNAVDIGIIKKGSLLHKYFINKEKRLYEASDFIGCMSQANVDYLKENFTEVDPGKIEVNPNSHELFEDEITKEQKNFIRQKYRLPLNGVVFIYGGNLGKPQGIDFLLDFLGTQKCKHGAFFLIVGSGTEYNKIKLWFEINNPSNAQLIEHLPKSEYILLVRSCDVGMIFLNSKFTIPNFPSRLLSFMEYKMPIIAATDKNTDLGKTIVENNFGLWSEAGDLMAIDENITKLMISSEARNDMGQNGYRFFKANYTVDNSFQIIMKHFTQ